eukprot:2481234-Pyramimonas_sp.AAC.1
MSVSLTSSGHCSWGSPSSPCDASRGSLHQAWLRSLTRSGRQERERPPFTHRPKRREGGQETMPDFKKSCQPRTS